MIYLIKSAAYDSEDNFINILKIGYTIDLGQENRFSAYRNHNPSCKVLFKIPEATEQDETNLHGYFKEYRIFNHEWYEYKEDIIKFFEDHRTKESLSVLPYVPMRKDEISIRRSRINYIQNIIDNEFLEFSDSVVDFLNNFYNLPGSYYRLKALCEFENKSEINIILKSLPPDENLVNYYETLGPERLRSLSYNITNIKKEIKDLKIDTSLLSNKIFDNFREGERYSKSDIKSILGKIYEDLEYSRTPKATDLERYFELRACQVPNKETGKRDNGFEIIKKKDQ